MAAYIGRFSQTFPKHDVVVHEERTAAHRNTPGGLKGPGTMVQSRGNGLLVVEIRKGLGRDNREKECPFYPFTR